MADNSTSTGPQLAEDPETVVDLDEIAEVLPYTYEITAYGADFPVDGLVKRLTTGDIQIPIIGAAVGPETETGGFQRQFVWSKLQADRFIESLLLGLPVPGVFLVREPSGVLLVLDGHQRLKTLQGFYEGLLLGKEFKLESVQPRYTGITYKTLDPEDRRRLDNSIIHATIVRQDQPSEDQSSIYLIFERLNSGGTILQPQEIRVALYHGPFADLLIELNAYPAWRALYGRRSARLKDVELILRFFALLYFGGQYHRPMKGFLNSYMSANRNLTLQPPGELEKIFRSTCRLIHDSIGLYAFKPRRSLNAAVLDSVMVGVADRLLQVIEIEDHAAVGQAYTNLLDNSAYLSAIERSTADEESVRTRLSEAIRAFATIE